MFLNHTHCAVLGSQGFPFTSVAHASQSSPSLSPVKSRQRKRFAVQNNSNRFYWSCKMQTFLAPSLTPTNVEHSHHSPACLWRAFEALSNSDSMIPNDGKGPLYVLGQWWCSQRNRGCLILALEGSLHKKLETTS